MKRRLFLCACLLAALLGGARGAIAASQDVVVFAAASLKDALDAINNDWQKATGKHATISYAASSTLAKQIEEGAPADVFISADLERKVRRQKSGTTPGAQPQVLSLGGSDEPVLPNVSLA